MAELSDKDARALREGQAIRDLRETPGGRLLFDWLEAERRRTLERLASAQLRDVVKLQVRIRVLDELAAYVRGIDELYAQAIDRLRDHPEHGEVES